MSGEGLRDEIATIMREHSLRFPSWRPGWDCAAEGCDWVAVVVADGKDAEGVPYHVQHERHVAARIALHAARRESEAAEKALAPIERLLASFGHVRDEDHGDDDDWPCVRCEMDRAIAQGRADSVAQGREEGGK